MWARGIVITFVVFASFMIGLVTICMKQDISLEAKDYYKDELVYQKKIDGMNNTHRLKQKPLIRYFDSSGKLTIDFDSTSLVSGHLKMYKPDQSKEDFAQNFNGDLSLDMSERAKGLWKIKIKWTRGEDEFYYEEPLFVN
jgi:hypothetical protein